MLSRYLGSRRIPGLSVHVAFNCESWHLEMIACSQVPGLTASDSFGGELHLGNYSLGHGGNWGPPRTFGSGEVEMPLVDSSTDVRSVP